MRSKPLIRHKKALSLGVIGALVAGGLTTLSSPGAGAAPSTIANGDITVNVTATENLTDGQAIGISVTANQGANLNEIRATQCVSPVDNNFSFSQIGGFCATTALSPANVNPPNGNAEYIDGPFAPGTLTSNFNYKVGVGDQVVTDILTGESRTVSCGPGKTGSCFLVLWIQQSKNAETYFSAPLTFVTGGAPTTTVPATTTTTAPTTTTLPVTTTVPVTTTTVPTATTVPGSTTTTVPTATTIPGSTTTTVPTATTIPGSTTTTVPTATTIPGSTTTTTTVPGSTTTTVPDSTTTTLPGSTTTVPTATTIPGSTTTTAPVSSTTLGSTTTTAAATSTTATTAPTSTTRQTTTTSRRTTTTKRTTTTAAPTTTKSSTKPFCLKRWLPRWFIKVLRIVFGIHIRC